MKSLLDRSFKYVPSESTNIRRTFARVRKQQAQQRATAAIELVRKSIDEPTSRRRHEHQ